MTRWAGFWPLLRLALRRDRIKLPVWLLAIAGMGCYFSTAIQIAYPDEADLVTIAGFMDSPAGVVMSGPGFGWEEPTHASTFAGAYAVYLLLAAAFMSILLVARHTRAEEEAGRLELVRAAEVGRHAPLAVATVLVVGAGLSLGVLGALLLLPAGYGAAGSWLYGACLAMVSLVFGAVALVTAQLAGHTRTATGLAALVIGLAMVVRGAGDVLEPGGSWLSWLSPFAWAQQTRLFYDDRWWPLLLGVLVAAATVALAVRLQSGRDLGAGLLPVRPGRERAGGSLRGPLTLALRLERGSILAWSAAVLGLGLLYGALAESVRTSLADTDNAVLIAAMGGDPNRMVDGYLATDSLFNGYVALCYAIVVVHRLTVEEREGRAGTALAAAVGRPRWLVSGVVTALLGTLSLLVLSGLGLGAAAALVTGEAGYLPDAFWGTLAYLPAIAVLAAVGALGFSWRPGWANLAWVAAVYAMLVGYLGFVLDLPAVLVDLSPLSHVAQIPLEAQEPLPLLVLTAVAAALVAVAAARFRRRDLTTG